MTKYTKLSILGASPIIVIALIVIIVTALAHAHRPTEVTVANPTKIDTVYVDRRVEVKIKPDTVYLTKPCKKSHCDSELVKPPKIDSIQ